MLNAPPKPGFHGGMPWPSIIVLLAAILCGNWYATQYAAQHYGGLEPLLLIAGRPVYAPWRWVYWLAHSGGMTMGQRIYLLHALGMGVGSLLAGVLLAKIARNLQLRGHNRPVEDLYGSARFALLPEMEGAGLLAEQGLRIGVHKNRVLRHTGPEHVLLVAPPRSGKGISLIVQLLLEHTGCIVVHDTKGELYELTAGYRSRELGHRVLKFSPHELVSDGYNPLAEVRLDTPYDVGDVQNIITILIHADPLAHNQQHWYQTAESIGVGLALHACYAAHAEGRTATLLDVFNLLTPQPGLSFRDYIGFVLTKEDLHPEARRHLTQQMNRSDEEFSSVGSSLSTAFMVFSRPLVQKATSFSSFRVAELMDHTKPVTLYVVAPPSELKALEPLIRLLFTHILQRNTESMDARKAPYSPVNERLLLLIDEAASLGRMDALAKSMAFLSGYNIQLYLVFQNLGQLFSEYGNNNPIMGSTGIKIFFCPNTLETQKYVSEKAGVMTIRRTPNSFSGDQGALFGFKTVNSSESYSHRPLMTIDEVGRMATLQRDDYGRVVKGGHGEMIIFKDGMFPIMGEQTFYFEDATLLLRSAIPPPVRTQQPLDNLGETLEQLSQ